MNEYTEVRFFDRGDAGQMLAEAVAQHEFVDPVVLALPHGGVPVGYEVAERLKAPLDIVFVRKLGAPNRPQLAIGAVVDGDDPQTVFNPEIISLRLSDRALAQEIADELKEVARQERRYRQERKLVPIEGATAIVVDDGIATGASIRAAIRGVKRRSPAAVVLATPVASPAVLRTLKHEVDELVCLRAPAHFASVGMYYRDFHQVSDEEVIDLLKQATQWKRLSRVGHAKEAK